MNMAKLSEVGTQFLEGRIQKQTGNGTPTCSENNPSTHLKEEHPEIKVPDPPDLGLEVGPATLYL